MVDNKIENRTTNTLYFGSELGYDHRIHAGEKFLFVMITEYMLVTSSLPLEFANIVSHNCTDAAK